MMRFFMAYCMLLQTAFLVHLGQQKSSMRWHSVCRKVHLHFSKLFPDLGHHFWVQTLPLQHYYSVPVGEFLSVRLTADGTIWSFLQKIKAKGDVRSHAVLMIDVSDCHSVVKMASMWQRLRSGKIFRARLPSILPGWCALTPGRHVWCF